MVISEILLNVLVDYLKNRKTESEIVINIPEGSLRLTAKNVKKLKLEIKPDEQKSKRKSKVKGGT